MIAATPRSSPAYSERPEVCLMLREHGWLAWGPYLPAAPMQAASYIPFEPTNAPQRICAVRFRRCRRCGCEQGESYQGVRGIAADPLGIERRLSLARDKPTE